MKKVEIDSQLVGELAEYLRTELISADVEINEYDKVIRKFFKIPFRVCKVCGTESNLDYGDELCRDCRGMVENLLNYHPSEFRALMTELGYGYMLTKTEKKTRKGKKNQI